MGDCFGWEWKVQDNEWQIGRKRLPGKYPSTDLTNKTEQTTVDWVSE